MLRGRGAPGGEDPGSGHQRAARQGLCGERGPRLLRAQAPPRQPGGHRAGDGELPQPRRTPGPAWVDRATTNLTRAVGLKLPQRRSPRSSGRESLHRHHVAAAAGAELGQRVLRDGAAQTQPLHLQEATVLRAPPRDVQLGAGGRAGGWQLPPALWEPAHGPMRQSKAPLGGSPALRLPQAWKAPGEEPAGALAPCVDLKADKRRRGGILEPTLRTSERHCEQ